MEKKKEMAHAPSFLFCSSTLSLPLRFKIPLPVFGQNLCSVLMGAHLKEQNKKKTQE
jgi:hypothetical protein